MAREAHDVDRGRRTRRRIPIDAARVGERMRQRSLSASGVAEYGDGDVGDGDVIVRGGRGSVGGERGLEMKVGTQLVGRLCSQPARSHADREPVEPAQRAAGDELEQLVRDVLERVVRYVEPAELSKVDELHGQVRDAISVAAQHAQVRQRHDPVDRFDVVVAD